MRSAEISSGLSGAWRGGTYRTCLMAYEFCDVPFARLHASLRSRGFMYLVSSNYAINLLCVGLDIRGASYFAVSFGVKSLFIGSMKRI
jgi:hypothetical protein